MKKNNSNKKEEKIEKYCVTNEINSCKYKTVAPTALLTK